MYHYRQHGLTVASDVPLPQARTCEPASADVQIRLGPVRTPTRASLNGEQLAAHRDRDGRGYSVVRRAAGWGYGMRFDDTLDIDLSRDTRQALLRVHAGTDPEVASILGGGFLLAAVMLLRGECVLHGTAVEVDGSAIVLVGRSGQGKSTLAACLAAAGGLLVAEDVVRVVDPGVAPACHAGATETRLRANATSLAELLPMASTRRTADGRLAVALEASMREVLPVRMVVLPYPRHGPAEIGVKVLGGADALAALLACPRIPGWFASPVPAQQFAHLSSLVRNVPVAVLTVPWGPPFAPGLGKRLLEALLPAAIRSESGSDAVPAADASRA